jgi:hypothetical protein
VSDPNNKLSDRLPDFIADSHSGTARSTRPTVKGWIQRVDITPGGEADNPDRSTLANFHPAAAGAILPPRASRERGNFSSLLLNVAGGNLGYFSDKVIRRLLSGDT